MPLTFALERMPQQNKPYRFLASEADIETLTIKLSGIGIESVRQEDDQLVCRVPWLDDLITIDFETEWWPDGAFRVDDRIIVTYASSEQLNLDVGALLRERLEERLSDIIIRELVSACSEISGKTRTTKPRSEQGEALNP